MRADPTCAIRRAAIPLAIAAIFGFRFYRQSRDGDHESVTREQETSESQEPETTGGNATP